MKRVLARIRSERKGSAAVLVALLMTTLLGAAALGVDVGRMYVQRQRLTHVTDAAVLSAAQFLPDNPTQAQVVAKDYLAKNGADTTASTITIGNSNHRVTVQTGRTVAMTLGKLLGVDKVDLSAQSSAQVSALSGTQGVVPIGVPKDVFVVGQQVHLNLCGENETGNHPGNHQHEDCSPGNYGALALGGRGASTFEQNLRYGYGTMIRAGDEVETEPGKMTGPTDRAVQYRIDQDPYATFTTFKRGSSRLMIVPIVESFTVNGRGQVKVVGFAVFFLEQSASNGSIIGRFVRYVMEGESSDTALELGVYITKLVR